MLWRARPDKPDADGADFVDPVSKALGEKTAGGRERTQEGALRSTALRRIAPSITPVGLAEARHGRSWRAQGRLCAVNALRKWRRVAIRAASAKAWATERSSACSRSEIMTGPSIKHKTGATGWL